MASEKPDSFQCGPFEVARNPNVSQFVEKLNRLREALDACRIQPGVGYDVNRSSGGTTLSIKKGQGGNQAEEMHPFKIYVRKKDKKWEAKIQKESAFYSPSETEITGLDEWSEIGVKDLCQIYLEAKISSHEIQSAKINFTGESTSLIDPADGAAEQTATRIPLGTVSKDGTIVQNVRTNVRTNLSCLNGFAYLLIVPL
jgi:hypothetical protein